MNKNYRGRDIVTRQWHYGDRVVHPDGTCFILNYSSRGGAPMWNRVIPDTVGQNTGMSDADGLPIFVGDIVQLKRTHYRVDPSVGCVAFCECHQDGTLNIGGILPASKFRHAECHVVGTLSDEAEPCCGNCRHFHNETSEGDGLCSQCGDTITTCGQTCPRHTQRI